MGARGRQALSESSVRNKSGLDAVFAGLAFFLCSAETSVNQGPSAGCVLQRQVSFRSASKDSKLVAPPKQGFCHVSPMNKARLSFVARATQLSLLATKR